MTEAWWIDCTQHLLGRLINRCKPSPIYCNFICLLYSNRHNAKTLKPSYLEIAALVFPSTQRNVPLAKLEMLDWFFLSPRFWLAQTNWELIISHIAHCPDFQFLRQLYKNCTFVLFSLIFLFVCLYLYELGNCSTDGKSTLIPYFGKSSSTAI